MPQSVEQISQQAVALRETGQYPSAVELLKSATNKYPDSALLFALLAQLLSLMKQDQEASEAINRALVLDSDLAAVKLNHARLLLKSKKTAEALTVAFQAYQQSPADPEVQLVLASILAASNQADKAFQLVNGIVLARSDYAEAFGTRAVLHLRKGDFANAMADAEIALRLKPHLDQLWVLVGSLKQRSGDIAGAIAAFGTVLRLDPDNAAAHATLGELKRLAGEQQGALGHLQRAIQLAPGDARAWTTLGIALLECRHELEAAEAFHKALAISPQQAEASNNLGVMANASGELEKAIEWFSQAVGTNPQFIEAISNLGACFNKAGDFRTAETQFRKALALNPDSFEALLGLGNSLARLTRYDEAIAVFQKAVRINPQSAEVYTNLGNTYREAGRIEEAVACQKQAIQVNPGFAEAYFNYGNLLKQLDRVTDALANYEKALGLKPDYLEALCNMGNVLADDGRFVAAMDRFKQALAIKPDYVEAWTNLGNAYKDVGSLHEAESSFRKALSIDPKRRAAFDNLLFVMNYHPDKTAEEIFAYYREFDTVFGQAAPDAVATSRVPTLANGKLRIGYVAPVFRSHSTRHFLEPLLANHDRAAFEIVAYAEHVREDEVTRRYRNYVDHWVPTKGVSDDELAKRIQDDGIQVLVDIAGHTAGNRLGVFARKPAPVSLHWLDYGYTTGLSGIDYYLCDPWTVPEGADGLFSESPWRLSIPSLVYRPAEGIGAVSPLPMLKNGHITFGTLTRSVRINHRTIRVWAEILQRVEGSVLVLDSASFRDGYTREIVATRFEKVGISRARLVMGCHSPPWDVLRSMDIGLDCFPHNSGTTLLEHLYMGVPFITLAERPSVGRLGAAILEGIGQPELIARTENEYVETVVALAGDVERLTSLRSRLRSDLQRSTLMDESGFARHVESAYRAMWQTFLTKHDHER